MVKSLFKTVLVTGGAGFIGSNLVDELVPISDRILVIDNLSTGKKSNLTFALESDKVELFDVDIRDFVTVEQLFQENAIEVIFHHAAISSVAQSFTAPFLSHDINLTASLNLFLLAQKYHSRKFIFSSSAAVYGDSQYLPLKEGLPFAPTSPYGVTKSALELYLRSLSVNQSFPETICLRFFNVYGPRQNPSSEYSGVISRFLQAAQRGYELIIFGDGEQTRDFVFVKDVCQANILAAHVSGLSGEVFNIATGVASSINFLAESIIKMTGSNSQIVHHEPRIGDIRHSYASIARAQKLLGFSPSYDLAKGLELTINAFK